MQILMPLILLGTGPIRKEAKRLPYIEYVHLFNHFVLDRIEQNLLSSIAHHYHLFEHTVNAVMSFEVKVTSTNRPAKLLQCLWCTCMLTTLYSSTATHTFLLSSAFWKTLLRSR